jgi:hypothetical protein
MIILYSLGDINIHFGQDDTFRYSYRKGHLFIAQWLYSLGELSTYET